MAHRVKPVAAAEARKSAAPVATKRAPGRGIARGTFMRARRASAVPSHATERAPFGPNEVYIEETATGRLYLVETSEEGEVQARNELRLDPATAAFLRDFAAVSGTSRVDVALGLLWMVRHLTGPMSSRIH